MEPGWSTEVQMDIRYGKYALYRPVTKKHPTTVFFGTHQHHYTPCRTHDDGDPDYLFYAQPAKKTFTPMIEEVTDEES